MQNGFSTIGGALSGKADLDFLKAQINDLVRAMAKKFAEKVQNKKEHQEMEKQIRNLYDLMMSKKD